MKKAAFSLCCVMTATTLTGQMKAFQNGVRQGRIVVKFKDNPELVQSMQNVSGKQKSSGIVQPFEKIPQLDQVSRLLLVNEVTPLFVSNPKFKQRFEKEGLDRWFVLDYDAAQSPFAVMTTLKGIEEIEIAEPELELIQPKYTIKEVQAPLSLTKDVQPVDDPLFPSQWHYHNVGQTGGKKGADINLVEAWKKRMAANTVIVAIMDQGVDTSHEDIRDNMWINEAELNGTPGVDDDGNGVIDDIYGYDFGNGYGSIEKGEHGTHVAGTVAAVNNNGKGVSGVAGGSGKGDGAKMMSLPVFGADQNRAANAFIYAADNGALISQNSWGYNVAGVSSAAFEAGIRYFTKYAGCDNEGNQLPGSLMKGGLAIFASGNMSADGLWYPACLEEVLAVSSLNHLNGAAFYTNYDSWVDVSSYGGETSNNQELGVLSTIPGNKYAYMQGTSMACPHVSGIAALSLAELGGDGFTNEMLRNYLTLTARDNEKNYTTQHKGKMGSGITDALKSMTRNDGVPPKQIEDLSMVMISDNYIQIGFTAPSKEDGSKVEGYKVLLTDSLNKLKEITITEVNNLGEKEILLLKDLNKGMSYSLSIVSFDIWGTTSRPAESVLFTTATEKGNLTYSKPAFTIIRKKIDFEQEQYWEFDIELFNNAKELTAGGLFWRADSYVHNHVNNIPVWAKTLDQMLEKSPEIEVMSKVIETSSGASARGNVYEDAGYKKWIVNRPKLEADAFIGEVKENGKMFTSSAAQKFIVPSVYDKGFSLSHFDMAIRTGEYWLYDDQVTNPKDLKLGVEIYKGGDQPRIENRIFSGQILDLPQKAISILKLPYAHYFEAGESFWVVLHADSRYRYPLGINGDGARSDNALYSSDEGKTWNILSSVYKLLENPVFTITALSDDKKGRAPIELTPSSGYLAKGAKTTVKAKMKLDDITEGLDSSYIVFNTDGTNQNGRQQLLAVLDFKRNEIGAKFSEDLYEFGMISQGDKKVQRIVLHNKGMGHFAIDSIVLSNKELFVLKGQQPEMILSGDSAFIDVELQPNVLGAHNTQLHVHGRDKVYTTFLIGTCVEAPSAELTPGSFDINIEGNQNINKTLTLRNTSNYSLRYSLPIFQDNNNSIREYEMQLVPSIQRTDTLDLIAGYKWVDNHMNKGYMGTPWVDISKSGIELTNKCDGIKKFTKVRLPFNFRYYDKSVKDIFVGINGSLRLDSAMNSSDVPVELPYNGTYEDLYGKYDGLIAPLWFLDGSSGHFQKVKFYYQIFEECVVFQYNGVQVKYGDLSNLVDFQIALYPDGSFEFRYNTPFLMNISANTFLVGWSSPNGKDGKTIYYMNRNIEKEMTGDYCIKVYPPVISPFMANSSFAYSGIVKPLSSIEIPFAINSADVASGKSKYDLVVETNDPENKNIHIPFSFNKKSALDVTFMDDEINFGEFIFGKSEIEKLVTLYNNSESEESVFVRLESGAGIEFSNGSSSIEVLMKPKSIQILPVKLKSIFDSKLIVVSTDGSITYDAIPVKASELIYQNYELSILDKKSLDYDLNAGEMKAEIIQISSDGKPYSSKLFVPGYIEVEEVKGKNNPKNKSSINDNQIDFSGYRWYSSEDGNAPQYIWTDISKTGTRVPLSQDTEYEGTSLPFDFPFYGNKYSKIYISPNGRISPFPLGWDVMYDYVPPVRLPDSNIPNPLISVMWNRQWYDFLNKDAGIYVDMNTERIIIQYNQFQYDWIETNGVTSYQAILYKDGTVQFVYKDIEECDLKDYVTIGMQGVGLSNKETDGYTYSLNSSTPIKNKTTITAKPMYGPYRVEAGQKVNLKLTANSYGYKAGEYKDSIILISENNQEMSKLPITMKVGSNANLSTKEPEINFGEVIAGDSIEMKAVNLMNSGNEDIIISSIDFEGADKNIFDVKRKVVSTEHINVVITYEPVELPLTLGAYGTETLYAFIKPENETKVCSANLNFATNANSLSVPFKANVLKPSALSVLTADGSKAIDLDLSNATSDITKDIKLSYEEGVNPIEFELQTRVINQPLIKARKFSSDRKGFGSFGSVVINKTDMPEQTILNMKPTAISSESIEPFGSVSIIGDTPPQAMIGTSSVGSYYGLSCMVKMNTGDKGFLMSHVRMWTNTIGRDTSHVEIRIYNDCKTPSDEFLIYEKAHKLRMDVPLVGDVYLPLEESIAFAPNQDFWVEVYFGVNLQMPMAVAPIPEDGYTDRNKYRLFDGRNETWTDTYDYPAYFAIWAIQESYSDLTKWIELTSGNSVINPLESVNGKAKFNYLHFPLSQMNLEVTAKTNKLSVVDPLIVKAKKYEAIMWTQFPQEALIVREGETVSFDIAAKDPAGNEITYQLSSPVDGVTIEKQNDGSAKVTYKASYLSSFVTNLNIEARTDKGLSVKRISIANANVNRAPKSLPVEPITLNLNSLNSLNSLVLPPSYFFVDPDGDAMQFRGNISSSGLGISLSEKGFVFTPIHEDVVDVIIVATDGEYEVTNKFRVNVVNLMNTPPVLVKTIGNKRVETGKTYTMDLSSYFIDQEGDAITFDAWATNSEIADVDINGALMTIQVNNPGESAIAIKATDSNKGETLTTLLIRAEGKSVTESSQSKITIAPNPSNSVSTISVEIENEQEQVFYEVRSLSGKLIASELMDTQNGQSAATIKVSGLTPGMYVVQVRQGSKVISTEKLIVTK